MTFVYFGHVFWFFAFSSWISHILSFLSFASRHKHNRSCLISTTSSCNSSNGDQGWFKKISNSLMVRKIEPSKDSHSRLLTADSQAIYELQIHDVKPGHMDQYLTSLWVVLHILPHVSRLHVSANIKDLCMQVMIICPDQIYSDLITYSTGSCKWCKCKPLLKNLKS